MLKVPSLWYERFHPHADDVREALVVSALTLTHDRQKTDDETRLELRPSDGQKCQRCWKYLPLGSDPQHPGLCAPCAEIVSS